MAAIAGANLAWQLGGDAELIRELGSLHDALVLLECRDIHNEPIDVAGMLGPAWWVYQDTSDGAQSGTAIAIRRKGKVKRRRVAHALMRVRINVGNRNVQERYLLGVPIKVSGKRATLLGAHVPTESSGKHTSAVIQVRRVWLSLGGRKLIFMDGNAPPAKVAVIVTAPNHSGNGVMVWAWSRGWSDIRVFWRTVKGSDHRAGVLHVPA